MSEEDFNYYEGCGCTFEHGSDEHCPECCSFSGLFAGGTEECEFCEWADFCIQSLKDWDEQQERLEK